MFTLRPLAAGLGDRFREGGRLGQEGRMRGAELDDRRRRLRDGVDFGDEPSLQGYRDRVVLRAGHVGVRDGAIPPVRHGEGPRGNADRGVGAEQGNRRSRGGLIDVAVEGLADRRVTAPVASVDAQPADDRRVGREQVRHHRALVFGRTDVPYRGQSADGRKRSRTQDGRTASRLSTGRRPPNSPAPHAGRLVPGQTPQVVRANERHVHRSLAPVRVRYVSVHTGSRGPARPRTGTDSASGSGRGSRDQRDAVTSRNRRGPAPGVAERSPASVIATVSYVVSSKKASACGLRAAHRRVVSSGTGTPASNASARACASKVGPTGSKANSGPFMYRVASSADAKLSICNSTALPSGSR